MKIQKTIKSILAVLVVLALCGSAWAEWSESVPVTEVNTEYAEWGPFLSSDGLSLYFSKGETDTFYYHRLYEATREVPYGFFTSIREISELNYSGGHIQDPWVSPDNLRLYYMRTEPGSYWRLKFSERTSVNDPWPPGVNISELNALGQNPQSPTLTANELTIFFNGHWNNPLPGGEGGGDIWMATRPDRNSPFGNITNQIGINTAAVEGGPSVSPDGLTLVFHSNRNGQSQLFKATREFLTEPFVSIEHLPACDTPEGGSGYPCLSSDGSAIYYRPYTSTGSTDIYVSYWIEGVTYHVDGATGDNTNDGLTRETAFATIQRGINVAQDCDTVLVWPGVYNEEIGFWGDAITVKSAADAAVVETDYGYAFSFFSAEGPNTVLSNFIIRDSQYGIYLVNGSSPTISNLTIVDNDFGISAYGGADPDIRNCIFWDNYYGDLFRDPPLAAQYSFVQDEVDANLVAYWKLDGDAIDSAGSNDGTIYGAVPTTGQINDALDFDGDDDYVDLGNDSSLKPPLPITLSAWINFSTVPGYIILLDDRNSQYYGIWFEISPEGRLVIDYGDGGSPGPSSRRTKFGVTELEADTWYHVAAVLKGPTDMSLYINAVDDGGTYEGTGGDLAYSNANALIGIRHGLTHDFNGKMDEVRIYNKALSAQEIEKFYQIGLAGHEYGPLFADADANDYHLLSERGRYWPTHDVWVLDEVSSPCIDGGDPNVEPSNERTPNGGRINQGAYGDTAYASMSEWALRGDLNLDGIVNFLDFAILAEGWLVALPWAE